MNETLIKDPNPAFCKTDVSGSTVYLMDCIALMKEYPDNKEVSELIFLLKCVNMQLQKIDAIS